MANNPRKDDQGTEKDRQNQGPQKRAEDAGSAVGQSVGNAANSAVATADQGAQYAGGGMRSAANVVRENAPREGMVGSAAASVADTLDQAGEYLEREGVSGAAGDFYALMQRYPITSALVGVALGYLIGRATTPSRS